MKRLLCTLSLFVLTVLIASSALAAKAPDAGVKGLWIKATNLPAGTHLEDMTQDEREPYFIYSFGSTGDGPEVTICAGRYPQDEQAAKIYALDKKTLMELCMSEADAQSVKDLEFVEAVELSNKFTYPSQVARYSSLEMETSYTVLFIQTDDHMFTITVNRPTKSKKYTEADVEKWLMQLEMVWQE